MNIRNRDNFVRWCSCDRSERLGNLNYRLFAIAFRESVTEMNVVCKEMFKARILFVIMVVVATIMMVMTMHVT